MPVDSGAVMHHADTYAGPVVLLRRKLRHGRSASCCPKLGRLGGKEYPQ